MVMAQHPVVVAAIDKLAGSLTPVQGILFAPDRSRAIGLFYALLDRKYPLDCQFIYDRLVERGWPSDRAFEVMELAELLCVDACIEVDPPSDWGRRVVDRINSEMGGKGNGST
ncbi:hypothetical protein [Aeromonas rivipollensis]|uniref:hypothetical protein n=1 Tax=Aeromonas rivipollensis TaxID=948519 RepID=UPI0038CFC016